MEYLELFLYIMENGLTQKYGMMARNIMQACSKIHFGICTRQNVKKKEKSHQNKNMMTFQQNGSKIDFKIFCSEWLNNDNFNYIILLYKKVISLIITSYLLPFIYFYSVTIVAVDGFIPRILFIVSSEQPIIVIVFNLLHPLNTPLILVTLLVSKLLKFKDVRPLQPLNI